MHSARRIIAQASIQVFGKFLSIVFGVVAIAIITRALGREGYGWYATIMAYLQLFGIAVDLGLNVLAPQALGERSDTERSRVGEPEAQRETSRIISNIFTIRLVAAITVFALASGVAAFIPSYEPQVKLGIALATFSFLSIVLSQILLASFQVAARVSRAMAAEVIGRAVLAGGVALAAWQGAGLQAMVLATVLGNGVMFALTFAWVQRVTPVRLAFDVGLWRELLARSWPIGLSILCNLVYLRADTVILSLLQPADHVGLYAAPYRLLDVLTQFPHLVMGLVLPMLASSWASGDRERFHHRLQHVFDGLAFIGLPVVAGSVVLGTPIMVFVAGAQFSGSGPILGVLAIALLGIFLGQPFGYAVVATGQQRRMLWGYASVAVVTLAGYLTFIPRYTYWGAAWMTVLSEVAIALITFVVVRRASGMRFRFAIPVSAGVASVVMAGVLLLTPALHVLPRVGLGIIAYALVVFALPPTRKLLTASLQH